jgi:glycogen phosphorylase
MLSGFGPKLPERIVRLSELANNLWWSWHENARSLFRSLDYSQWRLSGHNPVKQILEINADKLRVAASDPEFLTLYDSVMADFDAEISRDNTWIAKNHPELNSKLVAYFSAEFAIHRSLPIYAGGLGVLAGDLCKEASDLGLPLVAVGFMYPQGYFQQRISPDGWQEENYQQINFAEAPISPCPWPTTCGQTIQLELNGKFIHIKAWLVHVGEVRLYLLDTNCDENSPEDRQLSARLYTADREQRIQQEFILGIGGVRLLRALGINPTVWHANEGHTSFMMLERILEETKKGVPFNQAVDRVRSTTIFTTHTPVPAGHDVFSVDLVEKYFYNYRQSLGLNFKEFMQLGQGHFNESVFNMTILGLKLAGYRNAVSHIHQKVTQKMWHHLWPDVEEDKVPIQYVTNGVHLSSWIAPELLVLCEKSISGEIKDKFDHEEICQRVAEIPDEQFWEVRQTLRRKLIQSILESDQKRWADGKATPQQILAMGALLDTETLTIGFVRRFAEYKRPALIFHDIERLKRIVNNRWHPVQIIFAGKSHPADFPSKILLKQVYSLAADKEFQGRIAFVEDYDMHIARFLTQGIDVWLNNPRRLYEACGTSGMKAAINGIPHLSVRDGWWEEGYNGKNGWSINGGPEMAETEQDNIDAEAIYRLLEEEIVPLFYERDRDGIPHGWIRVVKEAFRTVVPNFCARRMLKQYIEQMYVPAADSFKTIL